jgi:predicted SAM-dependent methyltransferase
MLKFTKKRFLKIEKILSNMNYLNIGCGTKFHKEWINIDMVSDSPYVIQHNLLNGLPFEDEKFDVVYHSQVLEHFPKNKAFDFIKECYRVLKPNGIIRIVVPDLENIVEEYKKHVNENLNNPTEISIANYDWILLEMYDQSVRNYLGGQMAEYLEQPEIINEKYILDRIGFVGRTIREQRKSQNNYSGSKQKVSGFLRLAKRIKRLLFQIDLRPKAVRQKFLKFFLTKEEYEYYKLGKFRSGGEIHLWMYDRFSLKMLLGKSGFKQVTIKSPFESNIPDWSAYELDVKNGYIYDPTSLFIEGRKL